MDPADLPADALFHLVDGEERWSGYVAEGSIAPDSLAAEGLVHCSWGRQVAGTLAKHFSGATAVRALELDPGRIGSPVVEEDTSGTGQTFPHVYAAIPVAAVVTIHRIW